jgi:hypothetical protein
VERRCHQRTPVISCSSSKIPTTIIIAIGVAVGARRHCPLAGFSFNLLWSQSSTARFLSSSTTSFIPACHFVANNERARSEERISCSAQPRNPRVSFTARVRITRPANTLTLWLIRTNAPTLRFINLLGVEVNHRVDLYTVELRVPAIALERPPFMLRRSRRHHSRRTAFHRAFRKLTLAHPAGSAPRIGLARPSILVSKMPKAKRASEFSEVLGALDAVGRN